MGIGTLRRYHEPEAAKTVKVEPGATPTEEEAAKAAEAELGKIGEQQEEQRELAAAADEQPEGDAIHHVVEGQTDEEHEQQEEAEAHADAPKRNGSKADWQGYVGGLDEKPEGWESMTRDELATAILGKPQD